MGSDLDALLLEERDTLEEELERIRQKLAEAEADLQRVIQRLRHVRSLLGESDPVDAAIGGGSSLAKPPSTHKTVCDIAERVLAERNKEPIHYKRLAEEVISRGGVLSGAEPGATLVAKMIQDGRFVRPTAKGFYALRADYPTARNVGAKTGASRRRIRN